MGVRKESLEVRGFIVSIFIHLTTWTLVSATSRYLQVREDFGVFYRLPEKSVYLRVLFWTVFSFCWLLSAEWDRSYALSRVCRKLDPREHLDTVSHFGANGTMNTAASGGPITSHLCLLENLLSSPEQKVRQESYRPKKVITFLLLPISAIKQYSHLVMGHGEYGTVNLMVILT